ncbi:hypothetical protein FOJ82_03780 [Tessaracoccus rhinocerotis]|uniref:DUF4352 domain-containing protein n=1 Tax=Tessaracoccus rhinocerotis TaxID=1689449 RepID=A0A553K5M1_9ACTN|nr:hypothetical protein [Tessaracoccus rhinocerotis]TRY20003.1 hypothetical protein FOJ82_03780 [Tessaracoccus rhinocerotis]
MTRPGRILAFFLCLVGVGLVSMVTDESQMVTRWYAGEVGETISTPDYDVRVTEVRLAREVIVRDEPMSTEGVWVVVEWEAAAKRQSAAFSPVALVTADGTVFHERDEVAGLMGVPRTDPGFTGSGTSVFQLPPDALDDVELTIERSQGFLFTHGAGVRVADVVPDDADVEDSHVIGPPTTEVTR